MLVLKNYYLITDIQLRDDGFPKAAVMLQRVYAVVDGPDGEAPASMTVETRDINTAHRLLVQQVTLECVAAAEGNRDGTYTYKWAICRKCALGDDFKVLAVSNRGFYGKVVNA